MGTLWLAMRTWREWCPFVGRLLLTGDVGRFERESGEYRARHGIGED